MGRYSDDPILEQLYRDDEKLLGEQKDLWGSDEPGYRQTIDRTKPEKARTTSAKAPASPSRKPSRTALPTAGLVDVVSCAITSIYARVPQAG